MLARSFSGDIDGVMLLFWGVRNTFAVAADADAATAHLTACARIHRHAITNVYKTRNTESK